MIEKVFLFYSKEKEIVLKTKIFERIGIPLEYIEFRETNFKNSVDEYVHTIIIDDKRFTDKKDLIFIHGLGGSAVIYYDMLKELSLKFRIFAIDIPGTGCCSRVEVKCGTFQESENYFLDRLKFTIDSFQIKGKFTLLGHSMGGYISGLFSMRFPDLIENLILISPVGISSVYRKFQYEGPTEDLLVRISYKLKNPFSLNYRLFGVLSHFLLEISLKIKNFIFSKDDEQFDNVKEFMSLVFCNYCTGEKALFNLFDNDIRAYKTYCDGWKALEKINILFLYGDNDWNPKEHAIDLQLLIPSVKIEVIEESGHHMCFEKNYKVMTDKILEYVYNPSN